LVFNNKKNIIISRAVVILRWNRLIEGQKVDGEIILHANNIKVNNSDVNAKTHITRENVGIKKYFKYL
jgi:hypothetical protein